MPMSDPIGMGAIPESPPDDHEIIQRLRLAEATVESMLDALRNQETLVDDLSAATDAWTDARAELARVQQELVSAHRASGWRGTARAAKRRVRRSLRRTRPEQVRTGELAQVASPELDEEFVWEDARYARWIELYDTLDDARRG